MLCHPLLAPQLVTSQLLPVRSGQNASSQASMPVTIQADRQEKQGPVYKLHGNVRIDYGVYTLSADDITYNSDTGEVEAAGHLLLEGGANDEHIQASRGKYNTQSETGSFEHVTGSLGVKTIKHHTAFTTSNPFFFAGRIVQKTAPDHYIVIDGTVTTCELPRPKWEFSSHKVEVEVGGNARIYHSDFRIEGIPVLYLPFATHPVQKSPRQSGFLLPNIGRSSTRGYTAGESLFWAINQSMDLHAGTEYFSKRGWAPDAEFRARPTEDSFVDITSFSVFDRGINRVDQGGTEARLNSEAAFAHNFRGVANLDYLSSYLFRLAFSDVFSQAVSSEVRSLAFLSNATDGFFFNGSTRRYQNFESTSSPSQVITILHAPGAEVSSVEQKLWGSPFHAQIEAAAEGLARSEPNFSTAPLLGRFDLNPAISVPLFLKGWSFRPELSLRDTIYTQQLVPSSGSGVTDVGTAISKTLNRKSLEGSVELRPPAVGRVFDGELFGRKWKHVIEPRIKYMYLTGVENFPHVLRFDERDILTDTNEVEYAIVNRIYAKRLSAEPEECGPAGMPALLVGAAAGPSHLPWQHTQAAEQPCSARSGAREILSWEFAQKYYLDPDFGGSLDPGRRNVFTSTVDLTGIAFLTNARHLSPLISRLRVAAGPGSDLEWDADYDFWAGRVNTSTVLFNEHVGQFTVGAGNAFLHVPGEISASSTAPTAPKFNQFRGVLGYGSANKRGFVGAVNLGFDIRLNQVQYGSAQIAYNWDCCGVNIEYRRFALASVRNENQFRFTFALANVGSFGNLRRGERLF
jgi:LPS-assembly protein